MTDLISIIIPVYKVEKYINKCVDSVLSQSYENLEVILVDDGSPDSCGQICDDYAAKDKRVVVIHKANGGLSSARNAALDVAKGDYILCVDSDDYIHRDMVSKMLTAAKDYEADIVICSHFMESPTKLTITDRISDEVIVMDRMEALDRLVEDAEIKSYAWGKLCRREFFDGVRYPKDRNYEDIATTYYLFDRAEKIIKIPEYLYYYIVRDDSISYNNSSVSWHKGCHASCLGQEERAEYFRQKGYDELYEKAMAKLLPYLYSDIKSAYEADAPLDAEATKEYLSKNREEFVSNRYASDKDKKLVDIYRKNKRTFELYEKVKKPVGRTANKIRKIKQLTISGKHVFDFSLLAGKTRRVIYFELPCFDNLGDHAIAYSAERMLHKILAEDAKTQLFTVKGWSTPNAVLSLKPCIGKDDIIICQGGGNFGSLYDFAQVLRRKILDAFFENKIIIMPQTVFYEDSEKGRAELDKDKKAVGRCRDITIFARDNRSFQLFKEYFDAKVILTHDIVTQMEVPDETFERDGILLCLRSDKESNLSLSQKSEIMNVCEGTGEKVRITDTCTNYEFGYDEREKIILEKLKVWKKARLLVTDRLHGMIFALITETPCIVIGNNHHKVVETYNTIKDCEYIKYLDSVEGLNDAVCKMLNSEVGNLSRPVYSEDLDLYKDLLK